MARQPDKTAPWTHGMAKDEKIQLIIEECKKQAKQREEIVKMLEATQKKEAYLEELDNDAMWDSIATAYGRRRLEGWARILDLGIHKHTPRTMLLTGLSTLNARKTAWNVVKEASTGEMHRFFAEMSEWEQGLNAQICQAVSGASILLRGCTIQELLKMLSGQMSHGGAYPFVSMTISAQVAGRFAEKNTQFPDDQIVAILDAFRARKLGATAAQYSIAAEALPVNPREESVGRMFQLKYAHQMQAHFDEWWPEGSPSTLCAIGTVKDPSPSLASIIDRIGFPCISLRDVGLYTGRPGSA